MRDVTGSGMVCRVEGQQGRVAASACAQQRAAAAVPLAVHVLRADTAVGLHPFCSCVARNQGSLQVPHGHSMRRPNAMELPAELWVHIASFLPMQQR